MNVNVEIYPKAVLRARGMGTNTRATATLLSELRRLSDKRVPFDTGTLKNTAIISPATGYLVYTPIYARRNYYGKVMVGNSPGHLTPMRVTNKDIKFQGAPQRGPFWIERTVTADKSTIADSVTKVTGGKIEWR